MKEYITVTFKVQKTVECEPGEELEEEIENMEWELGGLGYVVDLEDDGSTV